MMLRGAYAKKDPSSSGPDAKVSFNVETRCFDTSRGEVFGWKSIRKM